MQIHAKMVVTRKRARRRNRKVANDIPQVRRVVTAVIQAIRVVLIRPVVATPHHHQVKFQSIFTIASIIHVVLSKHSSAMLCSYAYTLKHIHAKTQAQHHLYQFYPPKHWIFMRVNDSCTIFNVI